MPSVSFFSCERVENHHTSVDAPSSTPSPMANPSFFTFTSQPSRARSPRSNSTRILVRAFARSLVTIHTRLAANRPGPRRARARPFARLRPIEHFKRAPPFGFPDARALASAEDAAPRANAPYIPRARTFRRRPIVVVVVVERRRVASHRVCAPVTQTRAPRRVLTTERRRLRRRRASSKTRWTRLLTRCRHRLIF